MKKIIIILGIVLLFLSCEKEQDVCKCNGKYKIFAFPEQFYYKETIVDCLTRQPTHNQAQANSYFIKCE